MNVSLFSYVVIVLALVFASLPFLSERLFAFVSLQRFPQKPFWLRLLELVAYYFVIGGLGFAMEANLGNRFPQTWEFYAVTFCMFLVFAFPGFIYRYLKK
ncbi:MAG: DUF2818 family protein [Burkholderiaceae bacterium]|nr:MAG: DUF2818 family protein [Burkholderiaceae bacterium]